MQRWRFYVTAAGGEVVKKELAGLGSVAEGYVLEALKRAQRGELLPYEAESISGNVKALRLFLDGNTYRVLYAHEGNHSEILLALHVFHKKDRKLPRRARLLAEKRLSDWRERAR